MKFKIIATIVVIIVVIFAVLLGTALRNDSTGAVEQTIELQP